ncbi:MAG: hypothetical protein VXX80_04835 [Bacteroidota bacterium]|nr:hypothetical protein [Bacteroidota bacterium]
MPTAVPGRPAAGASIRLPAASAGVYPYRKPLEHSPTTRQVF